MSSNAPNYDATDQVSTQTVQTTRIGAHGHETASDLVAREEPLEIRLGPVSLAVVMRTPGNDEELAMGFLFTERVVERPEQVVSVRHCTTVETPEAEDNVIQIHLRDDVVVDLERLRRNLYASSSCGICGKATIENVMDTASPLVDDTRFDENTIAGLPVLLTSHQKVFAQTGGLHAAGLFQTHADSQTILAVREDVGRHNAVDKIVGWAARQGRLPLSGTALVVSGRISYEIVQKALAARVPVVVAISAPTSLAVALADAAGMTLVGFARKDSMNVYTHPERLVATRPG
ncbi:MAG: FdhD protein [Hyphomicrobiaceae bacterium]